MPTHYKGSAREKRALNAYIKLIRAAESTGLQINGHLQQHNLTLSQFGVLEALYHLGPLQPSELGTKILKSSGNMTTVIDNLEKRDLVMRARRAQDRRCLDIHLTDAGKNLVAQILPEHIQGVLATFSVLSAEEQETLAGLCRKVGLQ